MVGYISPLVVFFVPNIRSCVESKMRLGLLAHVCTVMYLFHVNKGKAVVSYVEIQKSERSFFLFLTTLLSHSKP